MQKLKSGLLFMLAACWPVIALCQSENSSRLLLSGGFDYFSNSFNGVPGARASQLGWDSAIAARFWHNVRFKFDVSGESGENDGASQRATFYLAGFEDGVTVRRERLFAHALFGDVGMTRYWGPKGLPGGTASFAYLLGGGVDTPISRHFAIRLEGDLQHTNLYLVKSPAVSIPYSVSGMPRYMGRFSTGLVWIPRLGSPSSAVGRADAATKHPPETDVVFEGRSSVGHYQILAGTESSYLHVGGVEYDRHIWGHFLKSRTDYTMEILPVVILRQPSKASIWGNPLSKIDQVAPGLGVSPFGFRLLWRDGTRFQPYYIVKFGVIAFTHKAFSPYASYENISFQQAAGVQTRIAGNWDFRVGVEDFHISNGFVVPNDPGIDELMYGGGLVYRLHRKRTSF